MSGKHSRETFLSCDAITLFATKYCRLATALAWVWLTASLLLCAPGAFGQERAKWGITAGSFLFPNCKPGYCYGDDISGPWIAQTLDSNAHSEVSAAIGSASVDAFLVSSNHVNFPSFTGSAVSANTGLYWNQGNATVFEGYHYLGETNKTFFFQHTLVAYTTATNFWNGIRFELYLCRATNFQYATDLGWLLYESGVETITNLAVTVLATNSGVLQSNTIACTVQPGERFYLVAACRICTFQTNGTSSILTPSEVTCLNPEGLISESEETDIPLRAAVQPDGVKISWRATRRPCTLESATSPSSGSWLPVTNIIVSSVSGSYAIMSPDGDLRFFRLHIQ